MHLIYSADKCVKEHTKWQDWNYVSDPDDLSRTVLEDGSVFLKLLKSSNAWAQMLFAYQTEMVFTNDSVTWFELEYQCSTDTCFDASWGVTNLFTAIHVYDEEMNFFAVRIKNKGFQISSGGVDNQLECSQGLQSTGIKLVKGGNSDFQENIWTPLSKTFGRGFDSTKSRGGIEDGKIKIRFINNDETKQSYLSIRVKYKEEDDMTSYLCAIDDSFNTNSKISYGVVGFRETGNGYLIQHIDVSACTAYYDIPRVWCESEESEYDRFHSWNHEQQHDETTHGLFERDVEMIRRFEPLVSHEAVTVSMDLHFQKSWNYGDAYNEHFRIDIGEQVYYFDIPQEMCEDWEMIIFGWYCAKRMFLQCASNSLFVLETMCV